MALGAIALAWFVAVIVPLIILFVFSFFTTEYFQTVYTPSFDTWTGLFASGRFEVTLRTLRVALTVTMIELVVGFPFALWLAKSDIGKTTRAIFLALLTIPFFLDLSSRTIVWRAILGQNGLINTILLSTGITDAPVEWLLYSEFAVHFGMIPALFPPMVLPIYMAISLIDDSLIEASNDLGASPAQTFWRVIFPLALPAWSRDSSSPSVRHWRPGSSRECWAVVSSTFSPVRSRAPIPPCAIRSWQRFRLLSSRCCCSCLPSFFWSCVVSAPRV